MYIVFGHSSNSKTISANRNDHEYRDRQALANSVDLHHIFLISAWKQTLWILTRSAQSVPTSRYEPPHDKTCDKTCATSKSSDQPAHPCSLIRVFTDRMCLLQSSGCPKRDQAVQRGINKNLCHTWWMFVCLFVLRFYGPVNPMGSCRARSVYLTTRLLGRLSPPSC